MKTRRLTALLLTVASIFAVGCSSGTPQPAGSSQATAPAATPAATPSAAPKAPAPVTLAVGSLPVAGSAQLLAAETLGYYKEEGLTVQIKKLGGGAEAIPLVEKGDLQFAFANHVSWIQAVAQGFNVIAVAGINSEKTQDPWTQYVMVKKDSGIDSVKKLEGKTVGVNNIKNFAWLYANAWFKKKGADITKIKFMEMPYPNMPDAVLKGAVDAVVSAEPFGTVLMQSGQAQKLGSPYEINPGMPFSVYVAKKEWAEANPDTVNRFVRAISKAGNRLQNDLAEQHKHIEAYTGMKPDVIKSIVLEDLQPQLKLKQMQTSLDLMMEFGLIKQPLDLKKHIWKDAKLDS